ncbi:polysaccharide biosynthesis/export family protein, partial [Escherichia coli]|nr:polysaccharide biosynthesis/export family protein [Escherichia coli]
MFRNAVLTTFIFFLVFSFTSLQAQNDDARGGYLIGPGDEITGKVLGEPQFDFVATVDEDGRIEVPFFDKPVDARC